MQPPQNLKLAPYLVVPAEMSGLGRFWAVYERLDWGAVEHVRYLGVVPGVEGESAEALADRVREQFAVE